MLHPKTRWGAYGIHMGISLLIFLVLLGVILFLWFPGALFSASGGWDGIKIIIGVDLVLGPTLTLIVYNAAKPHRELFRDLAIIATIQFTALIAGVSIVYNARPLALVHVFDTFYSFSSEDYTGSGDDLTELERLPGRYPKRLYVDVPQDKAEFISQHTSILLNGETPLERRVDLYRTMPNDPEKAIALLNGTLDVERGCVVVDLETPYGSGTVCYEPKSGRFSDYKKDT